MSGSSRLEKRLLWEISLLLDSRVTKFCERTLENSNSNCSWATITTGTTHIMCVKSLENNSWSGWERNWNFSSTQHAPFCSLSDTNPFHPWFQSGLLFCFILKEEAWMKSREISAWSLYSSLFSGRESLSLFRLLFSWTRERRTVESTEQGSRIKVQHAKRNSKRNIRLSFSTKPFIVFPDKLWTRESRDFSSFNAKTAN